jgi:energy-coupling factor transport system permease protein
LPDATRTPVTPADVAQALTPPRGTADPRSAGVAILVINALALGTGSDLVMAATVAVAVAALAATRPRLALSIVVLDAVCAAVVLWLPALLPGALTSLVAVAAYWTIRFSATVSIGLFAILTIRASALVAALRRLRVPRVIVIPAAVIVRMFPAILREVRAIGDAMSLRGLRPGPTAFALHPVRTGEMLLVPLLSAVVRAGDELTAAALVRGLGRPETPTTVTRLRFGLADAVLLTALAALIACALLPAGGIR